ncbi:MAG: ABC transporter ATP-binding protein [Flavobacteriia bacterium]|nr:ABC transporter ATP-binding protein [Flavobacteriia bacterium]
MKSLRHLNKYFIKYKWRFIFGILFTIISNYFGVKMPVYVKDTIDALMTNVSIRTTSDAVYLSLKIGGIYILLSFAKGFFLFLMRQTIIVMSRHIEFDLKNEIFKHYQKLDVAFFKKNKTGDLMNRISEDVGLVRMYLGPGIMYTINLIVLVTMIIIQMVQISPILTLYVLIPLPVMSIIIYKVSTKMNKLSGMVQSEQSTISTIAQETFAGIAVIKAYNRGNETGNKMNESADNYKRRSMQLVLTNALFMPTILFLIGISTILAIYIGGVMTYEKELSLGGIVAFIFFVTNLTWPFASIGWVTSIIQRAAASQKRINEFLQESPSIINTNFDPKAVVGEISFENVSFTYSNTGITALQNISFKIKKGDTLAILGHTGSGKSTILSLLLRQFDVESGKITVDGQSIQDTNLDELRGQSGMVPQDVFLFSDTIKNNILFGSKNDSATEAEIIGALTDAHVYHNIIEFPDGIETELGERGVNLSGGQKQRISIARALINNPVLLLLDDCLSAVDTETEEMILKNLAKRNGDRTTIIVSHRISTIRNATKIIVLEEGKIVETGNHESLLANNGTYTAMYQKQLIEGDTEA